MAFKKGESGNPKGRPKDSKNKATEDLRQRIKDFIDDNWEKVQTDFNKMDPEKRLTFLEKLLKYATPPLQSIDLNADIKNRLESMTDDQLEALAEKILCKSQTHEG